MADKEFKKIEDQIALLESRGLTISDKARRRYSEKLHAQHDDHPKSLRSRRPPL